MGAAQLDQTARLKALLGSRLQDGLSRRQARSLPLAPCRHAARPLGTHPEGLSLYTVGKLRSLLVDREGLEPSKGDVQGLPAPLRTAHSFKCAACVNPVLESLIEPRVQAQLFRLSQTARGYEPRRPNTAQTARLKALLAQAPRIRRWINPFPFRV